MSYGSGSQAIRGKTAALASLLVVLLVLGCHAFSAHCGRELDGGAGTGDGQTGRGGIKMLKPLPGKCVNKRCTQDSLDTIISCFCCLSTPENPCFKNEADCVKVCRPQVLPWSPPPPAPATAAAAISGVMFRSNDR